MEDVGSLFVMVQWKGMIGRADNSEYGTGSKD